MQGRIMLLVHRSPRAANAVRTVSPGGELFVASVVVCMILAAFGDAVDPALLGEAGLEFTLFDLGGETAVLAMRHWSLLQLLLAGAGVAAGIGCIGLACAAVISALRDSVRGRPEKVPIKF
jgi:hypothetical protein